MNQATLDYIRCNIGADVRQLALSGAGGDVDLRYALEQIAGRQAARRKLPSWAGVEGIEYPPHLSMEQCSGEMAAQYKAAVAKRIIEGLAAGKDISDKDISDTQEYTLDSDGSSSGPEAKDALLTDLTGGFGVDFSFMAVAFGRAVYVERQERLCDIARHNMPLLGLDKEKIEIVCADSTEYLMSLPVISSADSPLPSGIGILPSDGAFSSPLNVQDVRSGCVRTLIFLDPARRDDAGGRTYAIGDCTPDVVSLRDELLKRADYVMVKLSPMLDWRKAVEDMGGCVGEVHIVATGNECKDLLLVMSRRFTHLERLYCINDEQETVFDLSAISDASVPSVPSATSADCADNHVSPCVAAPGAFLFEPNASVMKSGFFGSLAARYGVSQVERNSHLFVSAADVEAFPGRRFCIVAVCSMNKKELKSALSGLTKANIAVRNFPLSVAELRKRLKLADGGDTYIFATTLADGSRALLICKKTGQ